MDDKYKSGLENLKTNVKHIADPGLHEDMLPEELLEILVARGEGWKLVWESVPTDQEFDTLYAGRPAFLYNGYVFERHDGAWLDPDSDVLEWLVDHPPFDAVAPLSDLYQHSRGLMDGASVWTLFQYVVGIAVTSQGMGLNSMMGIGISDAVILGRALEAWGEYADIAEPYIELVLEWGGE